MRCRVRRYFTGSGSFNRKMRQHAAEQGAHRQPSRSQHGIDRLSATRSSFPQQSGPLWAGFPRTFDFPRLLTDRGSVRAAGFTLNEHALCPLEGATKTKGAPVAVADERALFTALGLAWVEPADRELGK